MDVALLFPPLWYQASVPPDLSMVAGALKARGLSVTARDLSQGFVHHILGDDPTYQALRNWSTYSDRALLVRIRDDLFRRLLQRGSPKGIQWTPRRLNFLNRDQDHVPSVHVWGMDSKINPAFDYLEAASREIVELSPRLVGIALTYPDQQVQALVLARCLRQQGYQGQLVLYGALGDVLAPRDFAEDLLGKPTHVLFEDFDGVVIGEAEQALAELVCGEEPVNILRAGASVLPPPGPVTELPTPCFDWVQPEIYPFPTPVVDLRLGRGCPYARCAFCAIHLHQDGYRTRAAGEVAEAMQMAYEQLGSQFFQLRDEMLSPLQLTELGEAVAALPFESRWQGRARFQADLDRQVLQQATGLEELGLGLESANPRVRRLMRKGVSQAVIERVLEEGIAARKRLVTHCIVGFPGETSEEAEQTIQFLEDWRDRLAGYSLSSFILMRNSPVGSHPDDFGVVLGKDPLPRHERLRSTLPMVSAPGMDREMIQAKEREAMQRLAFYLDRDSGVWPSHWWLGASIREKGVPC